MSSEIPSQSSSSEIGWLLLIHQIPPKPNYLRVKVWRRLQRLGAVAIKNSVYVLPKNEQAREDFQWVLREIVAAGGDGTLCEARLIDGISDDQVENLFRSARHADYAEIVRDARAFAETLKPKRKAPKPHSSRIEHEITRLKRRFDEIVAIDFFGAPGREAANGLISGIEQRLSGKKGRGLGIGQTPVRVTDLQGKTWVTRKGIYVDRIASAWLVRRFIDPQAKMKFVPAKGYDPLADEIRFDMFEAEFTHEGDLCTIEVLMKRRGITDAALARIADIVHDIDLKDGKFGHPETAGIERLIAGIAMSHKDDETRLDRGSAVFDDLYTCFARKGANENKRASMRKV